ncbi:hypothetical protein K456DRAFT_1753003 [Colletotrichum gloeosporioides 23]|nr:hypothetical protein K456DRAFT_1753003 [Colletotrichum gloeosporioides 23]
MDLFGSSIRDHNVLIYSATPLLLSLAFSDNAMFGFSDLEALYELEIPHEDAMNLPIFRSVARDGAVLRTQMDENTFRRYFHQALKIAGYVGVSPSIHQIRRFLGKQVDERYTEVERCQHLTQTDRNIFGSSYVANCSSVDGLGAFLGEQADHSAVNFFQGIEKFRESGAPNVLPAAIEKALWQKREVADLEEQISLAVTADHKAKLSGNLRNLPRKLKATALAEYRDQWVRDRRDWKLLTRGKVSPGTSTSDGNLVVAFIPELERVERLMLSTQPLSSECMQRAMHDLYTLASKGFAILYYPGEQPIAG